MLKQLLQNFFARQNFYISKKVITFGWIIKSNPFKLNVSFIKCFTHEESNYFYNLNTDGWKFWLKIFKKTVLLLAQAIGKWIWQIKEESLESYFTTAYSNKAMLVENLFYEEFKNILIKLPPPFSEVLDHLLETHLTLY